MLRLLNEMIYRICKGIALICMVALFGILLTNVFIRYTGLPIKMSWYSEIAEILFAYMVFGMAAALGHDKAHFRVDLLFQKFKHQDKFHYLEAAVNLVSLVFYVLLFVYGVRLFDGAQQTLPVLGIPKRWAYLSIPVFSALLSVYALRDVVGSVLIALGKKTNKGVAE